MTEKGASDLFHLRPLRCTQRDYKIQD